ncbi:MAG TPA: ABC transporter permease [Blastococcus sp.]|jgi:ABC-type nitrate/sulfonate/bicarbonate transport system permease component
MTLAPAATAVPPNEVATDVSARRRPPRRPIRVNVRGLAFIVGLLLVLEAIITLFVESSYVPRPSAVFAALGSELARGDLPGSVLATLSTFAAGLLVAAVLGVLIGVVLGASLRAFDAVKLIVEFLRPLPSVAVIPFAILILGVGSSTSITVTAYAAFWPILFNTYYGVRDVNPVAVDTARVFGLSRPAILRRVLLPNAATNIVAGIRISAAIALILAITVEMITSSGGLGYYIVRMQTAIRTEDMYAGVLAVGVIGYLISLIVVAIERRVVFWKTDASDGGVQ